MTRPKLVQCLCPNGHLQTELKFRDIGDEHAIAATCQALQDQLTRNTRPPWCEVCGVGSETWSYEVTALNPQAEEYLERRRANASWYGESRIGSLN